MTNKYKVQNKKGFTLAELMAVIAIIAILAGIVLGSYWKSTEQAIFTEGLNGAQALAAAVDEYYYDNNAYPASMKRLAAGLRKATITDSQVTTTHFVYTIGYTGSAPVKIRAERVGGQYYIDAPLETANAHAADACVYRTTKGQEFCLAMGYTSCGTDNSCTK